MTSHLARDAARLAASLLVPPPARRDPAPPHFTAEQARRFLRVLHGVES